MPEGLALNLDWIVHCGFLRQGLHALSCQKLRCGSYYSQKCEHQVIRMDQGCLTGLIISLYQILVDLTPYFIPCFDWGWGTPVHIYNIISTWTLRHHLPHHTIISPVNHQMFSSTRLSSLSRSGRASEFTLWLRGRLSSLMAPHAPSNLLMDLLVDWGFIGCMHKMFVERNTSTSASEARGFVNASTDIRSNAVLLKVDDGSRALLWFEAADR